MTIKNITHIVDKTCFNTIASYLKDTFYQKKNKTMRKADILTKKCNLLMYRIDHLKHVLFIKTIDLPG